MHNGMHVRAAFKKVQKSSNGGVGMGCTMRIIMEAPSAILSRILAQSCVTPHYTYSGKGLCLLLIVLLKVFPCFYYIFRMVHPIPTSPFIELNTFFALVYLHA